MNRSSSIDGGVGTGKLLPFEPDQPEWNKPSMRRRVERIILDALNDPDWQSCFGGISERGVFGIVEAKEYVFYPASERLCTILLEGRCFKVLKWLGGYDPQSERIFMITFKNGTARSFLIGPVQYSVISR